MNKITPELLEAIKAIVGADIFQYFTLTFHYRTDKIFVENLITRLDKQRYFHT